MATRRTSLTWVGWGGTILFLISWLAVSPISSVSDFAWGGLMCLAAVACFLASKYATRWFLVPGFAAVVVLVGVLTGALIEQR